MKDYLARFLYYIKESEKVLIPKGTIYKPTEWFSKEGTMDYEPNIIDLLSFTSDDRFEKWT